MKKDNKKNKKKINRFGSSDCTYGENIEVPNMGTNWIYHKSYCRPDDRTEYKNTLYYNVRFLHVSAIYNVHALLGLEIQGDIRIHYGFNPQRLQDGPMFWESRNWSALMLGSGYVEIIKLFIMQEFERSIQIIND